MIRDRLASRETAAPVRAPGAPTTFERAGFLVRQGQRLGQVVRNRPAGITAHQWSSATRTPLAFVVTDPLSDATVLAVEAHDPGDRAEIRADRASAAVCGAAGLPLLRVESPACGAPPFARRFIEYVLDAYAYTTATGGEPPGYRDITGRLPDGREGFVNDLGAVARVTAVDAYVGGRLIDPIVRSLTVSWRDGAAEGWAWLDVREGRCLFARTRIWQYRFSCGVEVDRLVEDVATAAIGERLRTLDVAEPVLRDKRDLARELDDLKRRRDEMATPFAFEHVSFD
ncbi:DUF2726 domain-containing protein [Rugosimonospora africana]|uniref:DUF2726 domain-containing protein n=1 Tax=Rugosimonospora africana TaxID=556532 RepID=A0A8J3VSH8_9ACTN|nr:DUF2726 domain-containing protein [Rugosimonospora africana]GIH17277.1 hypothetical protein Raf01_54490 [Rugosimonospora africana]